MIIRKMYLTWLLANKPGGCKQEYVRPLTTTKYVTLIIVTAMMMIMMIMLMLVPMMMMCLSQRQ